MKKIKYLLIVLVLSSCQKEDKVDIPTYLKIDNIALDEGNTTSNITDAWVYVNDQLQGVYELPAKFPVLEEEIQTVRIKAGIKSIVKLNHLALGSSFDGCSELSRIKQNIATQFRAIKKSSRCG